MSNNRLFIPEEERALKRLSSPVTLPKIFQGENIKGKNGGHESQWMPISAACGGRAKFNFPALIARHFLKASHKDQARLGRY